MKNLRLLGIVLVMLGMLTACEISSTQVKPTTPANDVLNDLDLGAAHNPEVKLVTVPFKSSFYTTDGAIPTLCDETMPSIYLITQVGDGNATHLGKFTTAMTFCFDLTDGTYAGGEGKFIAANGDELWFTIYGQVLPFDDPDGVYDNYFTDPFTFTGGTGRFADAEGGGYTESYVINEPFRTDHQWTGTLSLVKGPKKGK